MPSEGDYEADPYDDIDTYSELDYDNDSVFNAADS